MRLSKRARCKAKNSTTPKSKQAARAGVLKMAVLCNMVGEPGWPVVCWAGNLPASHDSLVSAQMTLPTRGSAALPVARASVGLIYAAAAPGSP